MGNASARSTFASSLLSSTVRACFEVRPPGERARLSFLERDRHRSVGQRVVERDLLLQRRPDRPLQPVHGELVVVARADQLRAQVLEVDFRGQDVEVRPGSDVAEEPHLLDPFGGQVDGALTHTDRGFGEEHGVVVLPGLERNVRQGPLVEGLAGGAPVTGGGDRGAEAPVEHRLLHRDAERVLVVLADRDLLRLAALVEEDDRALEVVGELIGPVDRGERVGERLPDEAPGPVHPRPGDPGLLVLGERPADRILDREPHLGGRVRPGRLLRGGSSGGHEDQADRPAHDSDSIHHRSSMSLNKPVSLNKPERPGVPLMHARGARDSPVDGAESTAWLRFPEAPLPGVIHAAPV